MATSKRAAPKPASSNVAVRVRMYRQGLGDCFLLRFTPEGGPPHHVVIDCGLVHGAKDGKARMQLVSEDIERETAGRIDALVMTHEHYDHVSGFAQAAAIWARMDIAEVWAAWTDDPRDDLAKQLAKKRKAKETAFLQALPPAGAAAHFQLDGARAARVDAGLAFLGFDLASAATGLGRTRAAMDGVRKGKGKRRPVYLRPGQLLDDVPGIRTYVLGPPKDLKALKRSDPLQGEAYETPRHAMAYSPAARNSDPGAPFDAGTGRSIGADGQGYDRLFQRYFGASILADHGKGNGTPLKDAAWRRLPLGNMSALERLALDLDSDTNNTSLVLAFELPDGRVLLFAADAQAGNWASWHQVVWKAPAGAKKALTTAELLRNTVLYKAGHHISHNGTLKDLGLEQMVHRDLVALVPLDVQQAKDKGYGRTMPWPALRQRLHERTRGRTLLSDRKAPWPGEAELSELTKAERRTFAKNTTATDLYIDIHL